MNLDKATEYAKLLNDEKMGYRFQFPLSLKDRFEKLCEKRGVTMTNMILGLIDTAIKEDSTNAETDLVTLIDRLKNSKQRYISYEDLYRDVGEEIEDTTGKIHYPKKMMKEVSLEIKAIEEELKKRSR